MRRVDPYHLLFEGGQWYLVGHSHERDAVRVFRLSRIRGKVAYSTKAEHDFQRPADFDPRGYANRIPWQLGDSVATGEVWVSEKIAWYVERQFGAYGEMTDAEDGGRAVPHGVRASRACSCPGRCASATTRASSARPSWSTRRASASTRSSSATAASRSPPCRRRAAAAAPADADGDGARPRGAEAGIRPERFARLVTLASVLIAAGREERRLPMAEVCEQLQISEQELREDVSVLNVVNFGGGAYVIYAEVLPSGEIEVDPEPYSDTFDRPARLLPIEANALVAAIDLIGPHLAHGALDSAREKIVAALGHDPVEEGLHITSPTAADEITRAGRAARSTRAAGSSSSTGRRTRTRSRTA